MTQVAKICRMSRCSDMTVSELMSDYKPQRGFTKKDQHLTIGILGRYNVKEYKNTMGEKIFYLLCKDNYNIAGYFVLRPLNKRKHAYYEVSMIEVMKQFSGQNLAAKLYKFIVNSTNIIIQIGSSQTTGSRKIWYKLAADPSVNVYYYNKKDAKFYYVGINEKTKEITVENGISPYVYNFKMDDVVKGIFLSKKV